MKKWQIALIAVVVLLVGVAVAFKIQFSRMKAVIESAVIEKVDLSTIADGVYEGEFKYFVLEIAVDVTVKDHLITDIKIVRQKGGKGYEAHDTIDRILKAQSPAVDATTGATGSSKAIMIAVQNALKGTSQK